MKHNWEYKPWENVLRIINGKNQKAVENPDGKYPIYGSGGIMSYANDFLCPEYCTIIGRKGSINNPIYVETKFWNVDTAFGLCANQEYLLPRFLYYFCVHYDFMRHNKATTLPSLVKADLLKIKMPVPTIKEQEKIVAELDEINELIATRKKQLQELDNLAQSLFYDTFGDPITNPKGWEVRCFSDSVVQMHIGPFGSALKTDSYVSKEEGHCMVYEQKHAIKSTWEQDNHYISEDKYQELKRFEVKSGDFIMSCRGTIGKLYLIPENAPIGIIHPSLMKIRLDTEKYDSKFFSFFLPLIIEGERTKGNCVQMAITAKELGQKILPLPPLALQRQFATQVEAIEAQKAVLNESLTELQTLLDSRMDYWFN